MIECLLFEISSKISGNLAVRQGNDDATTWLRWS